MSKKLKYILAFTIFFSIKSYCQRNNIWEVGYHYIGIKSGYIDFSQGEPQSFIVLDRPMTFWSTNTSICDSLGNLLFYTNGQYIADRKNDSLQNCKNFNPGDPFFNGTGDPYSSALVILPAPGNPERYYVIGTRGDFVYTHGRNTDVPLSLHYSIVDMKLNNGYGGIDGSFKAVRVISDSFTQGRITACRHGNGRDWWVIAHQNFSKLYYKVLITPQGISVIDTQSIGTEREYDYVGQACFSQDGSKYAVIQQSGDLDIFDFDRCTGEFSNPIHVVVPVDPPYYYIYGFIGCAFSPSDKYLYVDDDINLYQYDLQSSDISSSRQLIENYYSGVNDSLDKDSIDLFAEMQLGPDNKIYMGTWNGAKYFHVINTPDSQGLKCDFKMYQLELPDYNLDIATYPNYNLGREFGSSCDTLTGINQLPIKNYQLRIIPNPTTGVGEIWIDDKNNQPAALQIYNTIGKEVYNQQISHWPGMQTFNISWLPESIYIIKVSINGKEYIGKVVKE